MAIIPDRAGRRKPACCLTAAVPAQPDAVPLRLHLAGLLFESGAEVQALGHFEQVLNRDPKNLDALLGATKAAEALGNAREALEFRRA